MYIFDEIVEGIALQKIRKWSSKVHKHILLTICVQNPNVFTADKVCSNAEIVNKIPKDRIKKVTMVDLQKLGCSF